MDCIFCKIVRGEIPSEKIYEDTHTIAILDINPVTPGHTLLLTKQHYPTLLETPPEIMSHLIQSSYLVIKAVISGMKAEGYNLLLNNNKCAGQLIPHMHLHIIPRRSEDGRLFKWNPKPYKDGEMAKTAEAIKSHIKP